MSAVVLNLPVQFETPGACPSCGIEWAVPSNYLRVRREKRDTFYCPNGHPQSYTTNELDKLKAELEQEKRRTERAKEDAEYQRKHREAAERSAAAARGQVTRIKNRVGNGVCPCCHRTFQNLMAHMKTKHPTFKDEPAELAH